MLVSMYKSRNFYFYAQQQEQYRVYSAMNVNIGLDSLVQKKFVKFGRKCVYLFQISENKKSWLKFYVLFLTLF